MQANDWQDYVRALSYFVQQDQTRLFFIFNAFDQPIKWQLPALEKGRKWQIKLDTSDTNPILRNGQIMVPAWSILIFTGKDEKAPI